MTEYELSDLVTNLVNGGTGVIAVIMSAISGYLIVAYLVGQKLTRAQVTLVNIVFMVFSSLMILAWVRRYQVALTLVEQLRLLDPERLSSISLGLIAAVATILALILLACLKFMWDVRHPKTE